MESKINYTKEELMKHKKEELCDLIIDQCNIGLSLDSKEAEYNSLKKEYKDQETKFAKYYSPEQMKVKDEKIVELEKYKAEHPTVPKYDMALSAIVKYEDFTREFSNAFANFFEGLNSFKNNTITATNMLQTLFQNVLSQEEKGIISEAVSKRRQQ